MSAPSTRSSRSWKAHSSNRKAGALTYLHFRTVIGSLKVKECFSVSLRPSVPLIKTSWPSATGNSCRCHPWIRPDQRQIPASLLKLAGYAMVSVAALVCADGHSSHNFIALEKAGARKSETIQSRNWKSASNDVKKYLADAKQKGRFDIAAEAYNGVVTQENTMERAFISRMYGPEMDPTCFVFQTFRPGTRTRPLAFSGRPKLNLGQHTIEQRDVWFDIFREGFCQHPEARAQWDRIKQIATEA